MGTIAIGTFALDALLAGGLIGAILPKLFGTKTAKECCAAVPGGTFNITDAMIVAALDVVASEQPDLAAKCKLAKETILAAAA